MQQDFNTPANDTRPIDAKGRTLFMRAIEARDFAKAEQLLREGAKVDARDKHGATALARLLSSDRIGRGLTDEAEVAKFLLRHGANACFILLSHPENKIIAVRAMIEEGLVEPLRQLLKHRMDSNMPTGESGSYLVMAAEARQPAIISLLLEHGADVNRGEKNGRSALRAAMSNDDVESIKLLLAAGADTRVRMTGQSVGLAMSDLDFAKLCSPEIAGLVTDASRKFELHTAAEQGDVVRLKALLKENLPLQTVDHQGYTPLMHAIHQAHKEVINLLLDHHADIEFTPRAGKSPLLLGIRRGRADVVKLLLDRGAQATRQIGKEDARTAAARYKRSFMTKLVDPYYNRELGSAVKQAVGLTTSVNAPQTARFRKGPMP